MVQDHDPPVGLANLGLGADWAAGIINTTRSERATQRNTKLTHSRSLTDDRRNINDQIESVQLPDAKNEAGLSLGHLLFKTSFVIG